MNRKAWLLFAAVILALTWLVPTTSSRAERALGNSGYCPAGTYWGNAANGRNTPNIAAPRIARLENRFWCGRIVR